MTRPRWGVGRPRIAAAAVVVISLLVPTLNRDRTLRQGTFLAGTGGVPGGREAGLWLRDNVPAGAQLLTIGPSMANILQFYGLHKSLALSVSPNPQSRNPSYTPVTEPGCRGAHRADPVPGVGHLHRRAHPVLRRPSSPSWSTATTAVQVFPAPTGIDAAGSAPPPAVIIYQVRAP